MAKKTKHTPKKRTSQLSANQRGILFLCLMPIIIYVIWGFHSGNYSRIYDNVQSTEVAITLPAKLQTIGDRIQSTVPPLYPHQVVNGQSVAVKAKKPKTTKPQIIINGPAQTNALFSTYPSWAQDFLADKSNKLDEKYWNVYQGTPSNGNNEAEYYTNKALNLHISDGALTLEATHQAEPQGYEYASALINTLGKQSFLYGRIDITAKLPIGVGTWPAAWFLPANTKYEDLSPARDSNRYLNGGEIDLIEEVGFDPNVEYGIVHSLSDLSNPGGIGDYSTINVPDNDLNYNVYSLLWTPTSITFEVDNTPFYTYTREPGADYKTWPFNQPFYLILNLAIGGTWGGEDTSQFPTGIDNSALPASMSIQSIYYYSYIGPTS